MNGLRRIPRQFGIRAAAQHFFGRSAKLDISSRRWHHDSEAQLEPAEIR
jgi:hypothetical protein